MGLTPSRTGIAIGRLVNAQLRFMPGSECASCGGINYFYFGHRHIVGELHNTVWFYQVRLSFPSHKFAFKYLINACAHIAFTLISGQLLFFCLNLP